MKGIESCASAPMAMLKIAFPFITVSRVIHTAPENLWDLLTDTARWAQWGPLITAVRCEDRYIRAGSTGRIRTVLGIWAPFIITEWTHRQYWSWRVFNISATGHRIERIDAHCSRLLFEVPWWAAPYALICILAAVRIARCLTPSVHPSEKPYKLD